MGFRSSVYAIFTILLAFVIWAASFCPVASGEMRQKAFPYGETRGGYGERKAVSNGEEARRMIKDYFSGRDVRIGDIRERELFFEADIRDKRGALVDKVIIDKRTGRIRSTY
ncbi:MAG TPA: hypothetical protein VK452_03750 [Dissulfurispiraceae bacterium]|nr:hypothetical protein [Dissulfurispiraceae bacterium]